MTAKLVQINRNSDSLVGMTFPAFSGLLFLVGSLFFWPNSSRTVNTAGAALLVLGSLCGVAVQFTELWHFRVYITELQLEEHQCERTNFLSCWPSRKPEPLVPDYEYKIHAHYMHIKLIEAILYMAGSLCYMAGSVLFFPQFPEYVLTHAAWVFILGGIVNCSAAVLSSRSGWDNWNHEQNPSALSTLHLHELWPSSRITASTSTVLYFLGNFVFAIGSGFFFPVLMDTDPVYTYIGVTLFMLGSTSFVIAAGVDVMFMLSPASQPDRTSEESTLISHSLRPDIKALEKQSGDAPYLAAQSKATNNEMLIPSVGDAIMVKR